MKTNNLILMLLVVAVSFLLGSTYANQTPAKEEGRTEEYAFVSVQQELRTSLLSIQIGSQPTIFKSYVPKKEDKGLDLTPIVLEMEKLNEQGYELINSSLTIIPSSNSTGFPCYTFMFKRKL